MNTCMSLQVTVADVHRMTPDVEQFRLDAADYYVCGVPAMAVETEDLLEDEGIDGTHVYTEGWEADAADE